ncbi:MAG: hypothetical protein M3041_18480 [Acidobacteriota bacterium]|nr:hypothetical protein [Acidobacteriota bacterium]
MKKMFVIAMLCAAAALAQEKPVDSPLVRAARASGGPKKKSTKKVITNADVKKSRGNLVVLPAKKGETAPAPEPQKTSLQKQEEQRKASGTASIRVMTAEKRVGELEKDLRRIEDSYYAENDPNYRDKTITDRFNQTKKLLDDARKELADARDAQKAVPLRSQ